ncbi:cytochrome P450 [Acrocarpospora macrocephala]|uniref:Cytochrome P450 n=1 Tax=Acrocarpospora macrocephala TaxID=150177 RepID=A0A5M3X4R8_9ACTN|nr:cytochrome P450 [Acrocarpospora macrocephala]GES15626.1 cytochrome P450 [Acrocarpospora macrocephala]
MSIEQTLLNFPLRRENPLDPPSEYARLRENEPVSKVRLPDGSTCWIVTRFDDARTVLTDKRFSADSRKPGFPILMPHRHLMQKVRMMNRLDLPEHTAYRRLFVKPFTSRSIENMRPAIQRHVDALLDDLVKQAPPLDLVTNFSLPVPARVICDMLGVPYDDQGFLQKFSQVLTNRTTQVDEVKGALDALFDYVDRRLLEEERSPGDGLLGKLVANNAETQALTHDELVATVVVLLVDGYETTSNMITLGVLMLFQYPDQMAELQANPKLVPSAVAEMLRYLSISDIGVARVADEDVELGGALIKAGEGVMTLIAAANHDDSAYPEATKFDVTRNPRNHLTFGHGIHQCLGQHLVTIELEVAFGTLIDRLPSLRPAVPFDEIAFKHDAGLYGVWDLPVTW